MTRQQCRRCELIDSCGGFDGHCADAEPGPLP